MTATLPNRSAAEHDSGPLHFQDATALAALIAAREVSSREVVQAHLDRIGDVNPKINAIVTLVADDALRAADAADAAVSASADLGPLHGVPMTVKDSIDTAGVLTQSGSRLFAGHVPNTDSAAVARFKAAGGILLAKTNLPEFSAWIESDNLVTGRTNNPWNLDRTPGGSSGGESAAIAAGMSPIGIGSDVAISVRGPAAFTGIAALKATHGRIPFTGHFAPMTSAFFHVGPMARTIRDVALAYSLLSGPDGVDGYAVHAKDIDAAGTRIAGQTIRVGWVSEDAFGPIDPEITAAVADAAARLADLGCHVERVDAPFLRDTDALTAVMTFFYALVAPYVKELAAGREDELHATGAGIVQMQDPTVAQLSDARKTLEYLRSAFAGYFRDYDVLLCPVTPMTAPPHGVTELVIDGVAVPSTHVMDITSYFNLTGLPALSVPYGFSSESLPIGIQLVSKWFDESTILRLGALLERRGGLGNRRPPVAA
jgi:aspartyl-tRNA(Asn)/glutamyl-tRNA(Gln) amidotransferase subunit A